MIRYRFSNKDLYMLVHRCTSHDNQEVATTLLSTDEWINKRVYTYNGIVFGLKEGSADTGYYMDESQKHTQCQKPVTKSCA